MDLRKEKPNIAKTALLALITAVIALLPAVILGRGMLLFSDDFTYQQQIFNVYYGDLYKSGNLFGYSWYTDLGSGVAASYSFYNLFSPFTLLFAFLPGSLIPYMTAPLLVLKYVVAAVLAYFFIKKFAKRSDAAIFGALLYAFSGIQTVNLLFPFHDMTAIFPLLLIGVEDATKESPSKWCGTGILAIAVLLSAVTNYYLFFGEIIFLIIYFLFRFKLSENWKGLLRCLLGGIVGVMAAMIVLLPSALSVLSNPRISGTTHELIFSWDRYLTLLQAYFMPTDVMGARNSFLQHACSSCSVWMPFVGMSLCFTYANENKKSRFTWLMVTCVIISLVPILNSAFSLFNANYYARWFFMPALIFALTSAISISDEKALRKPMLKGSIINIIFTVGTAVLCFAAWGVFKFSEKSYITDQVNLPIFSAYMAAGILCAVLTYFVIRNSRHIATSLIACVVITSIVVSGAASVRYSSGTSRKENHYNATSVTYEGQMGAENAKKLLSTRSLGDIENGYRVRTDWNDGRKYFANSYDNVSLLSKNLSVNSFISTVSGGIFEFYDSLRIGRGVTTVGDFPDDLMFLLSCRYHYVDGELIEAENYLPIGYGYTEYITKHEFDLLIPSERVTAMLNFLVVEDDTQNHGLNHGWVRAGDTDLEKLTERDVCTDFVYDSHGFKAHFDATDSKAVFFSVPYENGWTATVNGEKTDMINVNGLMAVEVTPNSANDIEFTYETPGLKIGAIFSVLGVLGIVALFVFGKKVALNLVIKP